MLLAFRVWISTTITFACMSAFALQIKAPDIAENGAVIPVEVQLDQPLNAGGRIELSVNGQPTAQLRVLAGSVSSFSTRVKGYRSNENTISAAAIVGGSQIESGTREVRTTLPAPQDSVGGSGTRPGTVKARTSAGKVLVLVNSADGLGGSLNLRGAGFHVVVSGSRGLSMNPFISVAGTVSGEVSASIEGQGGSVQASSTSAPTTGAYAETPLARPAPTVAQSQYGGSAGPATGGSGGTQAVVERHDSSPVPSGREAGGNPSGRASTETPPKTLTNSGGSSSRPAFALTEKTLQVCGKEIDRFHRLAIAYFRTKEADYCNKGKRSYRAENCSIGRKTVAEVAAMGAMRFYMKGNDHCEASDYPCFGPTALKGLSEDLLLVISERPTDGLPDDIEGYAVIVDQCVVNKVILAGRGGDHAVASSAPPVQASKNRLDAAQIAECTRVIKNKQIESQTWGGNINDVSARLGRFQKELFEGQCAGHPEAQAYIAGAQKMLSYGGNPYAQTSPGKQQSTSQRDAVATTGGSSSSGSGGGTATGGKSRVTWVGIQSQCIRFTPKKVFEDKKYMHYSYYNGCSVPLKVCDNISGNNWGCRDLGPHKEVQNWDSVSNVRRYGGHFVACNAKENGKDVHFDKQAQRCYYHN